MEGAAPPEGAVFARPRGPVHFSATMRCNGPANSAENMALLPPVSNVSAVHRVEIRQHRGRLFSAFSSFPLHPAMLCETIHGPSPAKFDTPRERTYGSFESAPWGGHRFTRTRRGNWECEGTPPRLFYCAGKKKTDGRPYTVDGQCKFSRLSSTFYRLWWRRRTPRAHRMQRCKPQILRPAEITGRRSSVNAWTAVRHECVNDA
jgi:hypothetical protein